MGDAWNTKTIDLCCQIPCASFLLEIFTQKLTLDMLLVEHGAEKFFWLKIL
jgi:hypothetical protein